MARHAPDFRYYEDYVALVKRYTDMGLHEMRKHAEKQRDRALKEKRFRPKEG